MSKLDFPIPHPNQDPGDELAYVLSILDVISRALDSGMERGLTGETVLDLSCLLSTARTSIEPVLRLLQTADYPDLLDRFQTARRELIVATYGRAS